MVRNEQSHQILVTAFLYGVPTGREIYAVDLQWSLGITSAVGSIILCSRPSPSPSPSPDSRHPKNSPSSQYISYEAAMSWRSRACQNNTVGLAQHHHESSLINLQRHLMYLPTRQMLHVLSVVLNLQPPRIPKSNSRTETTRDETMSP